MSICELKMMIILSFFVLIMFECFGVNVNTYYIPPQENYSKSLQKPKKIGEVSVSSLISLPYPVYVYSGMAGKKSMLKEENNYLKYLRVAVREDFNIEGRLIFSDSLLKSFDYHYFVGGLIIEEAEGVRLAIDFTNFGSGDSLWLYVPDSDLLLGPFPENGARKPLNEYWLPTIEGDNAILVLQSRNEELPEIKLVSTMFYYVSFKESSGSLPCPLPVACVQDEEYQKVSTGVGRLLVRVEEGEILCSGTLINDLSNTNKNFFITAHHCFDGYNVYWEDLEVVWDYRCEDCEQTKCPNLNECPRSEGAENVAFSECLDAHLIRLSNVPVGNYGRAYVGWDTEELSEGMTIYGVHHPQGLRMKSAMGRITNIDLKTCHDALCRSATYHATEVLWYEGITDFGSSGSGAFCKDLNFRLVGMLSNGPVHDCVDRSHNYDNFTSFRYFYPIIQCYLGANEKCERNADCDQLCFFKSLVYPDVSSLNFFRYIRSLMLDHTEFGKGIVEFYYRNSPEWINRLDTNPDLKMFLRQMLSISGN